MENISFFQWILVVDTKVVHLVSNLRNEELVKIFVWISLLGKWHIIVSAIVIATVVLMLYRQKSAVIALFLTMAGSELFNFLLKSLFQRQRPESALFVEHSFSFPSGHATAAVAFYGFITYLLVKGAKQRTTKVYVLLCGIAIIVAIGFSRLYLGVHFFSDVLGGYLLGLLWLSIGIGVLKRLRGSKKVLTSFS